MDSPWFQGAKPRHFRAVEEKDNFLAKCFGRRSQIGAAARLETYNVAVADAERAVKEIQEEIFSSVFDSIVNFVATSPSIYWLAVLVPWVLEEVAFSTSEWSKSRSLVECWNRRKTNDLDFDHSEVENAISSNTLANQKSNPPIDREVLCQIWPSSGQKWARTTPSPPEIPSSRFSI